MSENTVSETLADRLSEINGQMQAIQQETETATQTILNAAEQQHELIRKVRSINADQSAMDEIFNKLNELNQGIIAACSFSDTTNQRLQLIGASLDFSVNNRTQENSLENGPQRKGEGLSQSDIDAMLE